MLTKFSETISGKLGEQWIATVLTPSFAFWLGGFVFYILQFGWAHLGAAFTAQTDLIQLIILALALLGVAASGQIVQRFDLSILRALEGYWPRRLDPLRKFMRSLQSKRLQQSETRFQELDRLIKADMAARRVPDPELMDERSALDQSLRRYPADMEDVMPTLLGNTLRAAERMPHNKYGLDAIICWPRLWLLLPGEARSDISTSRQALDAAARLWLWGLLFLVWSIWSLWAIPIGLLVMVFAYRWMINSAGEYGDLIESAYDLYRSKLYQELRWPLPNNPAEEFIQGQELTTYLWRGARGQSPAFTASNKK